MKIGIIGAGRIGGSLGKAWVAAGHDVQFGVRDLDDADLKVLLAESGKRASAGTPADTAASTEVVVFAIPGAAMRETVATLANALQGKIIIDATNGAGTPEKAGVQLIAERLPGTPVYKAFNSVGFEILSAPQFGSLRADMFFCGDGGAGRSVVTALIRDIGFNPMYVGDLSAAPMVEMLARLWGSLAYGQQHIGRRLAFRMLTADDER